MAASARPVRVLFYVRHYGVGGIETALMGWLRGLDRTQFAPALAIGLPTREFERSGRTQLPADVAVHAVLPADSWLVRLHQRRREGRLGPVGRVVFGLAMKLLGERRLGAGVRTLAGTYDLLVDYDLSLRPHAPRLPSPLVGVRHFMFWHTLSAKARRVGAQLRHYDQVLVLNEPMRAQAQALYGDTVATQVVPNAFDLDTIRQAAREPLPDDAPAGDWIVCVARLDGKAKDHETLIRAYALMLAGHDAAQKAVHAQASVAWSATPAPLLVLVGDGPHRPVLEQLVASLGLVDKVFFAGVRRNPHPWTARARVAVLSSRSEGLPTVLIEALALDTAVVATDCPVGPRDVLDEGRAGRLVPVGDATALADAMAQALQSSADNTALRQAGAIRAETYGIVAGNARMAALVQRLGLVLPPAVNRDGTD